MNDNYIGGITKFDIAKLRKSLHIGKPITVMAYSKAGMMAGQGRYPQLPKELPINGIYPHLVTAYDEQSGLTYSKTYVDMLTPAAGKKGGISDGR